MWSNDYIQIPFAFDGRERDGLDCWGLAKLVYKDRLGIDLPNFNGALCDSSRETLRKIAVIANEEKKRWVKVDTPMEYDIVLMSPYGGLPFHVGIALDRKNMLHIHEGINSCVEPFNGMRWKHRVEGVYRYAKP